MNYNIQYPLKKSEKGYFFKITTNKRDALKSNLLFFLTTEQGERLYKPKFGLKLKKYLFDMSGANINAIQDEIIQGVQNNFTGLSITNVNVEIIDNTYNITVEYNYTDGAFTQSDVVIFNL